MGGRKFEAGDVAPDFTLPAVDGQIVSLSSILSGGRKVLLVFLRHLGWLACREHVAQLCQHQDELKQFNTEVLIISFGTPKLARKWIRETCSPFTMLLDPERKVYSTYGLERSWLGTWNLNTLWFYIRMVLSGRRLRGIQGDPIQMGGNFIVDAGGIVRLAYRSKEVIDRPPVSGLLASLRGLESRK